MALITFLSTVYNKQLKEKDAYRSVDVFNEQIQEKFCYLSDIVGYQKQGPGVALIVALIRLYKRYNDYKNSYKIFAQNGECLWDYTED